MSRGSAGGLPPDPTKRRSRGQRLDEDGNLIKEGSPEWFQYLRDNYKDGSGKAAKLTTAGKFATAWKFLYDKSDRQVREKFSFSENKWRLMKRSDEYKKWQEYFESVSPEEVRDACWRAEAFNLTLEYPTLYDLALGIKDVNTAFRILKEMTRLGGLEDEVGKELKANVTIRIEGAPADFLDSPAVETSYEIVDSDNEEQRPAIPPAR